MPVGIIINSLSIAIGGAIGALVGHKLAPDFKDKLQQIFSLCAMLMGVASMSLMENMPPVVFAVIIGTAAGLLIHLEEKINGGALIMQRGISKFLPNTSSLPQAEFENTLITIIVLFCASGTGIYGSIVSGMSGDHSILIAKSILDFFTAMIFACILGMIVACIAVPQFIIFFLLFLLAGVIYPLTTPTMINDFKAVGGVLLLATGFRMAGLKKYPTADMIPAMILAMPASWLWTDVIMPLLK